MKTITPCKLSINCDNIYNPCLCSLNSLFYTLGLKWIPEIITVMGYHNKLRFGEIKDHMNNISATVLTDRLNSLLNEKIIQRIEYNETPPRVEYNLTDRGIGIWEKLQELIEIE